MVGFVVSRYGVRWPRCSGFTTRVPSISVMCTWPYGACTYPITVRLAVTCSPSPTTGTTWKYWNLTSCPVETTRVYAPR